MIKTAQQLKALVRNLSTGDSAKAQEIMRSYATERFLERLSLSPYRDSLILKGGTLVSAIVGLDNRATMDIDATVKNIQLSEEEIRNVLTEILSLSLEDCMTFKVKTVRPIMDDVEYPGIRVILDAFLEKVRIPMKIDFSTNDVITPGEVCFEYKLLFEDRTVSIMAYNIETVLAEKLQTIIARDVANTRMRDFYDIHILGSLYSQNFDAETLAAAFAETYTKRGTTVDSKTISQALERLSSSPRMQKLWDSYRNTYGYASSIEWNEIMVSTAYVFTLVQ